MAAVQKRQGRNAPCSCGSGRKFKHCCGQVASAAVSGSDPALLREAARLYESGEISAAAAICKRLLDAAPGHAQARYVLGLCLAAANDLDAGAAMVERAFADGLEDAAARFRYADILIRLERYDEAADQLEQSLAQRPDFPEARNAIANLYFELKRDAEAEAHYRQLVAHQPTDKDARHNLALVLYHQNKYDEAITQIDAALDTALEDAELWAIGATYHEALNRVEQAASYAARALAVEPGNITAAVVQARLQRRASEFDAALTTLNNAADDGPEREGRITLYNERARLLDDLGRFDEAFEAALQSKKALSERLNVQPDGANWEAPLASTEGYIQGGRMPAFMARRLHEDATSPRPIFVIGFFRSGTTLVEQILANHHSIAAGGELQLIPALEQDLAEDVGIPFPDCLDALTAPDGGKRLEAMRQSYLEGIHREATDWRDQSWVVDKNVFNSLHLPLIHLLFPDAPILRLVRHPGDVFLSCMLNNFRDGSYWSLDQREIAQFLSRVTAHIDRIQAVLPLNCLDVRYEQLIDAPEHVVRDILNFIGEPWEPACLDFHQTNRVAVTASYEQVSRPIFKSSVNKYRNYKHLFNVEALGCLETIATRLGYEM